MYSNTYRTCSKTSTDGVHLCGWLLTVFGGSAGEEAAAAAEYVEATNTAAASPRRPFITATAPFMPDHLPQVSEVHIV